MSDPIRTALITAGLLSETGEVAGVGAAHPDAELLTLIGQRSAEQRNSDALWDEAVALGENHPEYLRLWSKTLAAHRRACKYDAAIARAPATTREAAAAKIACVLESLDPDPRAHNEQMALMVSVLRDALRALEGDS